MATYVNGVNIEKPVKKVGNSIVPSFTWNVGLGSATVPFSDLFLGNNGVLNFNNGDFTITHSAGKLTFSGVVDINTTTTQNMIFPAGTTQSLTAGTQLTRRSRIKVVGNGGPVTIGVMPSISKTAASDGEMIIIQGTSNSNTVTLQDESNLSGSGLYLAGGNNFTLGNGDILVLIYDNEEDAFFEISRSDN